MSPQSDYWHIYTFTSGSPMGTLTASCLPDPTAYLTYKFCLNYYLMLNSLTAHWRVRTFLLTSSLLSGLKHLRALAHIFLLFYTIFRMERKAKSSKEGKYKNLPGARM